MNASDFDSEFNSNESDSSSDSVTRNSTMFFGPDGKRSDTSEPVVESALTKFVNGDWIHNRYLVEECLGRGGFGIVYRAFDSKLVRHVAIKIALKPISVCARTGSSGLVGEARATAKLDHENLVRVYDIDDWNNHTYAVMELVNGKSLEEEIRDHGALPLDRVFSICKDLLAAMAHMQEHGVVHRDLKPSNVLITERGKAKITDLGLAITDETPGTFERRIAGTRRYMAPEQILGEIHRIDGRTDIWGFGLILYEMLVKKPAFRQEKDMELFQAILRGELESPKVSRVDIPESLEAICLKCLSPRTVLRFRDTDELAAALKQAESDTLAMERAAIVGGGLGGQQQDVSGAMQSLQKGGREASSERLLSAGDDRFPTVVPRGLRPFDAQDHEYYMRLMPGPYDLNGKPAIVSTWQAWAENLNADAQPVGVIYGPSGCGKSSFVLAALIPSLNRTVRPIYCNLTVQNPVAGILAALHGELEYTQEFSDLLTVLSSIRKRQLHYKVLLVLDQFEQYLAGHPMDLAHPIVQALRQCDGRFVQAILLVRSEYWNEISALMQMLEQPLSDESNASGLPQLSVAHAKRVLESFGRAYEAIPAGPIRDSQREFLDRAVASLADDNQVLCVHLSIFAELMRHHAWDVPTLTRMGGANGVLSRFLSNAFDSINAPMTFRASANVCADILRELVPENELALKTAAQPISSLAAACNETPGSARFRQAMRCLDQELHVLMKHRVDGRSEPLYSLSHDYLVQPIKNWLALRDSETWRGRARNSLVQAAIRLKRDPGTRQLLSPLQWAIASIAVPKSLRSEMQNRVLAISAKRAMRGMAIAGGICIAALFGVYELLDMNNRVLESRRGETRTKVSSFITAESASLEGIWNRMQSKSTLNEDIINELKRVEEELGGLTDRQKNRRDLLVSLNGAILTAQRIGECIAESDGSELSLWESALRNESLRDAVIREVQSSAETALQDGKQELQLIFLKLGDTRLLTDFASASDPMVSIYENLAAAAGSSDSELTRLALFVWKLSQKDPRNGHYLKLFAIKLLSMMEQSYNPIGQPLTEFLAKHSGSTDRASALSCQTFQSYLAGKRTVVPPVEENDEWMVESCIPQYPFVMIHLPSHQAQYKTLEAASSSSSDDWSSKTNTMEVAPDVWLAREEVSFGLFRVFEESTSGDGKSLQKEPKDCAAHSIAHEDILQFCNWLSERAKLQPAYALNASPPESKPGFSWIKIANIDDVYWNPLANGYRLPSHQECALAAVHAQPDHYWSAIGRFDKFQQRYISRQLSLQSPALESWVFFPNAWGFSGLMGNNMDIVIDDSNRLAFIPSTVSSKNTWAKSIPYERTNIKIFSFRVARGGQPKQVTDP